MSVIDSPGNFTPIKASPWNAAKKWGIYGGVAYILVNLLSYLLGVDPQNPMTNIVPKVIVGVAGFGLTVYFIVQAIKQYREELGGYISLGQCIVVSILSGLVVGIIAAIWAVIFMKLIAPTYMDDIMAAQMEQMSESMSEEQMEMVQNNPVMGAVKSPLFVAITTLFMYPIYHLVVGLIAGLFLKRERAYM